MFMRKVTAVAASVLLVSSVAACGGGDEPVGEGQAGGQEQGAGADAGGGDGQGAALVTDPVPLLEAAQGVEGGLSQCSEEMTVDLAGFGKASCIVPDEYLAVGVESNILQAVVYADEEQRQEFLDNYVTAAVHEGPGYLATAPTQELLDAVIPAMDEAAAEQTD